MNVDGSTRGGRLGSTSQCRPVPARKNRSRGRLGFENEPTAFAAAHRRVRVRSVATVSAVATAKSVGSRGSRAAVSRSITDLALLNPADNARGFRECRPRHYPLRSPVTRAPSVQARHAPGIRLSQGLLLSVGAILRNVGTCPLGSTGAAERGPALGTRVRGSRCRGGQDLWTQWTATKY